MVDNPGSRRRGAIGHREIHNTFFIGDQGDTSSQGPSAGVVSGVSLDVYERLTLSKRTLGTRRAGEAEEDEEKERSRSLAVPLIGYVAHAPW